jgi:hypothetical protein
MTRYDVFNGDADGICALQQLRLHEPGESELVTGVKRDIELLERVTAQAGDTVTVLDVSLDKNREGLLRILAAGASVHYFDHHFAGEIPSHAGLHTHIDTAGDTCTSLIVNNFLGGRYARWAIAAAYGDNAEPAAERLADSIGLDADSRGKLRELGIYMNYNAYGETPEDLHFTPQELVRRVRPYSDPLEFVARDPAFADLKSAYLGDVAKAENLRPHEISERCALYLLPCAPWARRVSGVFANQLAQANPQRAHALLTELADGAFVVSVRAPLATRSGADELCRQFATGGGRKAAAGINHLPKHELDRFSRLFRQQYGG